MDLDQEEFARLRSICPLGAIDDLRHARANNPLFNQEIREFKRLLEKDKKIDESHREMLLCLVKIGERSEPQMELQDGANVNECVDNPDPEEENDPRQKRKSGPSIPAPDVENQPSYLLKADRFPTQGNGVEKMEKVKCSPNNMVHESELLHLHQNDELEVNEKNSEVNDVKKEAEDELGSDQKVSGVNDVGKGSEDRSDSDVEILDSEATVKEGILSTFVPIESIKISEENSQSIDTIKENP